ncbi:hypothetical protein V5R04_09990 [Jonesiaceae bacterium BS-20]|uniref:Transposase n=1 Tax=Jonesiaceae bacterium BS-20 TaxID=3120821 RepID=A0AAU7DUX5_9MICO
MADYLHRSIARARRVLDEQQFVSPSQVDSVTGEDLDRIFNDGRKTVSSEFVPIDIEKIVAARRGRKKPPLKVLWAKYRQSDARAGVRHYGYDRFCELVAEHVRVNDLTAPIKHVPGQTVQVDWADTRMQIIDAISRVTTLVSAFVASLPLMIKCGRRSAPVAHARATGSTHTRYQIARLNRPTDLLAQTR